MASSAAAVPSAAPSAAVPSAPETHPSYEDMILHAISALKGRKGSSWYAISKYISENFSDLPPTHASLLSHHLRLLHSKGSIRMLKLCYKLHDPSTPNPPAAPKPPSSQPKRRGRSRGRPPKKAADGPVYIISQAEQLSSGLLQSFPGAVAIVVPKSLLTEKAARSPIVILPKGIQSLIDAASVGERKKSRRKRGRPRKEEVVSSKREVLEKGAGRPWKIRDLLVPGNVTGEAKKRSVGRPRKKALIEVDKMVQVKEGVVNATSDRETKIAFCDVCLKEIVAGNRPSTHFNREGWSNVTKNFLTKIGRDYDKTQLKNKWDQMKKDWKIWKEFKHGSTGLGWDNTKKTVGASDDWWKEKLRVLPQAKEFRYAGIDLELEDKLD